MKGDLRKSYEKIEMSKDARERIYRQILKQGEGKRGENSRRRSGVYRWKTGMAACLVLGILIPTGVYAVERISNYRVSVTLDQGKYQADISLDQKNGTAKGSVSAPAQTPVKEMRYIHVAADFGRKYRLEGMDEVNADGTKAANREPELGTDGMHSYHHKDGFDAGKDFYYNIMYMDKAEDYIVSLYDQEKKREIEVNGHRALLCQSNTVQGSRYRSDYDTSYTIDLFVFYEEYGYIIEYCGMQGLGEEALIRLAESTEVTETTRDQASRYECLSRFNKASTEKLGQFEKKELSHVSGIQEEVVKGGFRYQVTDVLVSSQLTDSDYDKFNTDASFQKSKLWDDEGRLKTYLREKLQIGDGTSEPRRSVAATERVQLKMVYVTMKVKKEEDVMFCLPDIIFAEKENGKYYNSDLYEQYSRPAKIRDAMTDRMPCYFKETAGGKRFWLKDMAIGEEQIFHFAYMVDEDLVDNIMLRLDSWNDQGENMQCIDIIK